MIIKQSPDVAFQVIDGKAVIVLPKMRMIHWLNDIGTDIWKFVSETKSYDDVVKFICDSYEVDQKTAGNDVNEFISQLKEKSLVEIKD